MAKSTRHMTNEERRAYRKRRKLIRRIQVYSELGAISLAIVIIGGLIVSHIKGTDDTMRVAAEESVSESASESEEEEAAGLKVTTGASTEWIQQRLNQKKLAHH